MGPEHQISETSRNVQSKPQKTRGPFPRLITSIGLLALACTQVAAEDFPNLVGTWSVSDKGHPTTSGIASSAPDLTSMTVRILRQNGSTFSGTVIGPKRKLQQIIGYVRRDRKTFVYSSVQTAGSGKVQGELMEMCRTDAGCAVLTRTQ